MSLTLITAPTIEPVSLCEIKNYLKVDTTDDDLLLTDAIKAARHYAEMVQNRSIMTTTWRYDLPDFPCRHIRLPHPQVQSVSSLQYVASDGTLTTLDSSEYTLDQFDLPARIYPAYGEEFPSVRGEQPRQVRITYVAGYTTADLVPPATRQAIRMLTAELYENRSPVVIGTIVNRIPTLDALLAVDRWIMPIG